jgi:hypothetical protein
MDRNRGQVATERVAVPGSSVKTLFAHPSNVCGFPLVLRTFLRSGGSLPGRLLLDALPMEGRTTGKHILRSNVPTPFVTAPLPSPSEEMAKNGLSWDTDCRYSTDGAYADPGDGPTQ